MGATEASSVGTSSSRIQARFRDGLLSPGSKHERISKLEFFMYLLGHLVLLLRNPEHEQCLPEKSTNLELGSHPVTGPITIKAVPQASGIPASKSQRDSTVYAAE